MFSLIIILWSILTPALLRLDFNFSPLDTELLSVELWPDKRNFEWLDRTCDFNGPCRYGSHESKWKLLKGTINVSNQYSYIRQSELPRLPAIGFGSKLSDEAHLFSDPLPCLTDSVVGLSVWSWGAWRVQICLLNFETGGFEVCGTAFSGNDTALNIFNLYQSVPNNKEKKLSLAIVIIANVRNGFFMFDDLSYNGTDCARQDASNPVDIIVKNDIVSNVSFVRNEVLTVLSMQFSRFREFLMLLYRRSPFYNEFRVDTICKCVPCNFDCDWRNYTSDTGLLSFKRERTFVKNERDVWEQISQVAHFKSEAISFAILTSPKFYLASVSNFNIDSNYHLSFKVNKAACDKQLIVCTYKVPYANNGKDQCSTLTCTGEGEEWFKNRIELPKDIERFQIIVNKHEATEHEFDETIIRDINILGC